LDYDLTQDDDYLDPKKLYNQPPAKRQALIAQFMAEIHAHTRQNADKAKAAREEKSSRTTNVLYFQCDHLGTPQELGYRGQTSVDTINSRS
jgi:hypothetical protein